MNPAIKRLLLAAAVMNLGLLGGCGAQHLTVERISAAEPTEGVCYSLPKTLLQMNFAVTADTLVSPDDWKHPDAPPHYVGQVRMVATLIPRLVPDATQHFAIKGNRLSRAAILSTNLSYTLDDQGMLVGVDSSITDVTGEVIKEFATTAVELAKATAKDVPTTDNTPADRLQAEIDDAYKSLADEAQKAVGPSDGSEAPASRDLPTGGRTGGGGGSGGRPAKGAESQPGSLANETPGTGGSTSGGGGAGRGSTSTATTFPELKKVEFQRQKLAVLREALTEYRAEHEIKLVPATNTFSILLDPAEFKETGKGYVEAMIELPAMQDLTIPRIYVRIFADSLAEPAADSQANSFSGVVYRPTKSLMTEILREEFSKGTGDDGKILPAPEPTVIGTEFISYPQYSPLCYVPIEGKSFGESATTITFSPISGGLQRVNVSAKASAENMASAAGAAALAGAQVYETENSKADGSAKSTGKSGGVTAGGATSDAGATKGAGQKTSGGSKGGASGGGSNKSGSGSGSKSGSGGSGSGSGGKTSGAANETSSGNNADAAVSGSGGGADTVSGGSSTKPAGGKSEHHGQGGAAE